MPASYPGAIFAPRTVANKTGVTYDATKTKILYAEDINKATDEIVAIETFLRIPTSIPDSPVAGSAYFTTVDFTLHIYTGAAWKVIALA